MNNNSPESSVRLTRDFPVGIHFFEIRAYYGDQWYDRNFYDVAIEGIATNVVECFDYTSRHDANAAIVVTSLVDGVRTDVYDVVGENLQDLIRRLVEIKSQIASQ